MAQNPLPAHIVEMLARPNPAVIGHVRPDGAPVTVATWYLWEDSRILVNMDEGRRRLHYARTDPRVSLTVLDPDDPGGHVSVQGRMTLSEDADLSAIDRIARHYTGQAYPGRDRGRVSGWIDIETWHAWGRMARP